MPHLLMIPKTCAYIWIIVMGLQLLFRAAWGECAAAWVRKDIPSSTAAWPAN